MVTAKSVAVSFSAIDSVALFVRRLVLPYAAWPSYPGEKGRHLVVLIGGDLVVIALGHVADLGSAGVVVLCGAAVDAALDLLPGVPVCGIVRLVLVVPSISWASVVEVISLALVVMFGSLVLVMVTGSLVFLCMSSLFLVLWAVFATAP